VENHLVTDKHLTELPLSKIRTDGGTQTRATLNMDAVDDYALHLAAGGVFPPVIAFKDSKNQYWLADGFHRHKAHEKAKRKTIICEVIIGELRDAILYAVGCNVVHGLRRSNEDKQRAVMILLKDAEWAKWSDRQIAERCGVSNAFVSRLRKSSSVNGTQMRTALRGDTVYEMDVSGLQEDDIEGDEDKAIDVNHEEVRNEALEQVQHLTSRMEEQIEEFQAAAEEAPPLQDQSSLVGNIKQMLGVVIKMVEMYGPHLAKDKDTAQWVHARLITGLRKAAQDVEQLPAT
jgi:transcriptional regulator with XRE-family HTH domain